MTPAEAEALAALLKPYMPRSEANLAACVNAILAAGYARRDETIEESAKVADAEVSDCIANNDVSKMHWGVGAAIASKVAAAIRALKGTP